jgi:formylglycine-generating enzyme required for sulfatase activity
VRRKVLLLGLLLLLGGAAVIAWSLADLPPPGCLLRYGFSPGCEPTGDTVTLEGVEFVEIGPGISRMGSTLGARGGDWLGRICAPLGLPWGKSPVPSNEMPVHWVEFPRGFWIARTEVTNAQYERFDPGHERSGYSYDDDDPVVNVSWEDAERYCAWLSRRSSREIRLPSESEWECACRAGSEAEYCFGNEEEGLEAYAWFDANSEEGHPHPVATKRANRWGLFDLHGNVWEWCEDSWHESYEDAPDDGSPWRENGEEWQAGSPVRVGRGGSTDIPATGCRSASRYAHRPAGRSFVYYWRSLRDFGFRPAFDF